MGDIIPPSRYIKNEFYKIKVGSKHLKMSIYETDNLINIYIGGPKLFCIHATVNKPESIFVQRGIHKLHVGSIEKIYYNQQCSLEHNFVRGVDTNMIICLLCQYVRDKYSYVTHLQFSDASSRTCDLAPNLKLGARTLSEAKPREDNRTDVSLMVMTYLYSEMTWYQKNFEAIVVPDQVAKLKEIVRKYNEQKQLYTWEAFNEIFIKGSLPIPENQMKEMYDSAETWMHFFNPLMMRIKIAKFCNFISPWLSTFIERVLKYEFLGIPYMFVLDKLPSIEYEITPFITGGRLKNFTKKRARLAPRNEM